MQSILSDHNCEGQSEAIFEVLAYKGYLELIPMKLIFFRHIGLPFNTNDEQVWRLCQENNYLLLTGNRSTMDGTRSLEFSILRLLRPDSLPVVTIGNLRRVKSDPAYCQRCAEDLADIVLDLETSRGVPRLYIPARNR